MAEVAMTSRFLWSPGRTRLLAAAVVLGGLLVGGMPATAAPAAAPAAPVAPGAPAAPAQGWQPDVKKPDPVTLPGTKRTITPFASPLRPTQPKALPGVKPGIGSALKADDPAGAAVRR